MSAVASAAERANPGVLPQPFFNICLALVVVGVVSFIGGLTSDPQTAWLAYHANFIFFTMMACGGLVLTAIYSIVGARWPGPYKRFAESLAAFIPISLGLGIVGIFGGQCRRPHGVAHPELLGDPFLDGLGVFWFPRSIAPVDE